MPEPSQTQSAAASAAVAYRRGLVTADGEDDVAALTLDDRGMVCDCNRAGAALFKYRRSELVWRHVSMLLPQLANMELMQNGQPNQHLRFLCRIGRSFQAVTQDGEHFSGQIFLNVLDQPGRGRLSLIVRAIGEGISANGQPSGRD